MIEEAFFESSQYSKEIQYIFNQKQDLEFVSRNTDGANGEIIIAKNKQLNREVAIKIYDHEKDPIKHEPTLVADIDDPNIIKVYDAGRVSPDNYHTSYYVMEYGDCSLKKYLDSQGQLPIRLAIKLFKDLLKGLSCFHSTKFNLIHRDLKSDNLLVVDEVLKIGDFGSVKQLNSSNKGPVSKHSIFYRPPESFGTVGFFDKKSDIYQAGLIFLELLGCKFDFNGENYLSKLEMQRYVKLSFDADKSIFIDTVIKKLICGAKLIDYNKLPFYIDSRLINIVKKMVCSYDRRFKSVSEILIALSKYEVSAKYWLIDQDGNYVLDSYKKKSYQIYKEGSYFLLKQRIKSQNFTRIPTTKEYSSEIEAYKALMTMI